jgi:hypothetical protein
MTKPPSSATDGYFCGPARRAIDLLPPEIAVAVRAERYCFGE